MNEHTETTLRGWARSIIALGCFVAALFGILSWLLASNGNSILPLLIGGAFVCDILAVHFFVARLTEAFADITENTRNATQELQQLNINILKIYSDDIHAADRAQAEKERLEQEQAKRIKAEREREAARKKETYWKEHAEEKAALLAKKAEAQEKLKMANSLTQEERKTIQDLIKAIDTELEKER